jgi:hypothetical protein
MRSFALFVLIATVGLCLSCGTDHENLPTGFAYNPPPTPENVAVVGGHESSTISWSYPAEARASIGEFRVYQYSEAYNVVQLVGTTADTAFTDSLLVGNLYYCYKVSAVDTTGFEGWRTPSVCAFVRTADPDGAGGRTR